MKKEYCYMLDKAIEHLLKERVDDTRWIGELAPSALSTATAVCAMALTDPIENKNYIDQGILWLAENVNKDGGWGDTILSLSNISTTVLVWSAFAATDKDSSYPNIVSGAQKWINEYAGGTDLIAIANAISKKYGKDKTFAIPILTMCALSGRLGKNKNVWKHIAQLPFELAALPHQFFSFLRLPVVSYALPALIAIGQARHHHRHTKNPITYILRKLSINKTLRKLQSIQPATGGYLEAIPLTSFVTMSLASFLNPQHPQYKVVKDGITFLQKSMRTDGSWPIDINLTVWGTTLSINALAISAHSYGKLTSQQKQKTLDWLLKLQHNDIHPFTHAAPGGWAWIDLPGGVPDADDTPGAIIALANLANENPKTKDAAQNGMKWLVDLQNSDGGIPTFCKGWGTLPFDRSTPDLTAHTLSAWSRWYDKSNKTLQVQVKKAMYKSICYLRAQQQQNGSWIPLWFGNQHAPKQRNPLYGTARVVIALLDIILFDVAEILNKGKSFLLETQNQDGGWGGDKNVVSSIEETALAIHALAKWGCHYHEQKSEVEESIAKGLNWLYQETKQGCSFPVTPIGLYYASLWYYEKLYPVIFTIGALSQTMEFYKK